MFEIAEDQYFEELHVRVIKAARRTLKLQVINGEILLYVPYLVTQFEINRFVFSKINWLRKKLANPIITVSFEIKEGESAYIFGKRYSLHLVQQRKPLAYIEGDSVVLCGMSEKSMLNAWKELACGLLDQQVDRFRRELRYDVGDYYFHYHTYSARWGCCFKDRREVILNIWCVSLPEEGIRYIFYHELAHLKYANHQKEFYTHLAHLWSDYRKGLKITKSYRIT